MHSDELNRDKSASKFVAPPSKEEGPVGPPVYLEKGIDDYICDIQVPESGPYETGGWVIHVPKRGDVEAHDQVIPRQNILVESNPDSAKAHYETDWREAYQMYQYWVKYMGGSIVFAYHTGRHPGAKLSGGDLSHFSNLKEGHILTNIPQVVFDVEDGKVKAKAAYRSNPVTRDYIRAPLVIKT